MSKVLVFGNGYLGSHLKSRLLESGFEVAVVSRSGSDDSLEADLGDLESIRQIEFEPDWVVHCASSGRAGPDAYKRVFVEGVKNLNAVFPDARKVFTSSTSVYPQITGEIVTETSPANPDRQTSIYLREAEDALLSSAGIVLRLAGIYGPGRSIHLRRMQEGTARIESGRVSRWLNQIHRDDAAQAIKHLIETNRVDYDGEIYNVCDDSPITQRDCYETLARLLERSIPEEEPPDSNRKRAWTNKRVSNQKLRSTGWEPLFPSFVEAARTMI